MNLQKEPHMRESYLNDCRLYPIDITVYVLWQEPTPKGNKAGPNCSTKWAAIHGLREGYPRLHFTHPRVFGALRLSLSKRCNFWVRTPHKFVVRKLLSLFIIPRLEYN